MFSTAIGEMFALNAPFVWAIVGDICSFVACNDNDSAIIDWRRVEVLIIPAMGSISIHAHMNARAAGNQPKLRAAR